MFFTSVQSLLRVSKHICIIRYPEFIHKKINQALKLHFTVVEVLALVNPNVTNSQCQHTLNYHLINKNMKTIISLIYLKKNSFRFSKSYNPYIILVTVHALFKSVNNLSQADAFIN